MTFSFAPFQRDPVGDLYTAVIPYAGTDDIFHGEFEKAFEDAMRFEARVHGADFDYAGFQNVLKTLANRNAKRKLHNVEALYVLAAWHDCTQPSLGPPKIIAVNVNFRELFMRRLTKGLGFDFGIYSEDVCLLMSKIKELAKVRPTGMSWPEGGIGKHVIKLCMQHYATHGMKGGIYPVGQNFECAIDNTNIVRIQQDLGAVIGSDGSCLFRANGLTRAMRERTLAPVQYADVVLPDGMVDPNNFAVVVQNGNRIACATFTDTCSTFGTGNPKQCQILTKGQFSHSEMQDVVASSLIAGEQKILIDRLNAAHQMPLFDPNLLIGSARDKLGLLFACGNNELSATPRADNENLKLSIRVENDSKVVTALESMNVPMRKCGNRNMQTASLDLTGEMRAAGTMESAKKPGVLVPHLKSYRDLAA